jgi:polyphosphate kinase
VLAIKLTIYRTSSDSPIVRALADAARQGKQVAVLVEITARFDEAPNIQWGKVLENEGAHVAYGVERLKTHVKLALVVREERGQVRHYAHIGTGNYHPGTARVYEDLGILTAHPGLCAEVAAVFNGLTGTTPYPEHGLMLIAPVSMRQRFGELIRREAEHAREGRPSGLYAKMNQLQDPDVIRELYRASQAGVPITLNIRGLCCLRPGVPGVSETIRVYSVVGRFLEHSRLYRFTNGGAPAYYIGSADWMHRNLTNRIETVVPVLDPALQRQLDEVVRVYETDNCSAWDCAADGTYVQRRPADGETCRAAQTVFLEQARGG